MIKYDKREVYGEKSHADKRLSQLRALGFKVSTNYCWATSHWEIMILTWSNTNELD